MGAERINKFEARRQQLEKMNDDELKSLFWKLCHQVVEPMVEYGRNFTSPSIERSVLLRMGIDSQTSQAVVIRVQEAGLLAKGAGHVVYKLSGKLGLSIRDAARKITEDSKILEGLF